MKKYEISIKGTSPLIWNVQKKELQDELSKLKKNELAEWDEKNWRRRAAMDEKGNVIVPGNWFKQALIGACKKTRMVPHYATRKNETYTYYVTSFMVDTISEPLCKPDDLQDFGTFVGAQGSNSNTKVWRTRPMLKNWSVTFQIIDAGGRMTKDELKTLIEYVGLFGGLGDNRINNYGRFELVKLKEVA